MAKQPQGTVLADRYEIMKPIASGGMATVYLGRALGVGGFERLVAIKLMHSHIASEAEFVSMFLDEARLAARIRHPNVVPTLDVQVSNEGLFLVMEYVEGPSLHQLRKAATSAAAPIPQGVALRILIDTLGGLQSAHELTDDAGQALHLVHRDVSPANILVGTDGVARITDFGVARAEARLSSTRGGQLKGKLPYMPPEQLMNETVDQRCDVYAAGVVLWEVLVGERLFEAESDGAMLGQILTGPRATPRQQVPSVPSEVDAVCMRALAKSKDQRYASAAEFAEALEQAAASSGLIVASTRAVAAYVRGSSAFKKILPQELAELKRGTLSGGAGQGTASQPGSSPSVVASAPAAIAEPQLPRSSPTEPSQVTITAAELSAPEVTAPAPKKRLFGVAIGAAAVAVLGAVGLWSLSGAEPSVAGDASGHPPPLAASAVATAPPTATADAAPTGHVVSAAASASSAPAVSAAGQAKPAKLPTVVAPPAGRGPRPGSPGYNPDRL